MKISLIAISETSLRICSWHAYSNSYTSAHVAVLAFRPGGQRLRQPATATHLSQFLLATARPHPNLFRKLPRVLMIAILAFRGQRFDLPAPLAIWNCCYHVAVGSLYVKARSGPPQRSRYHGQNL